MISEIVNLMAGNQVFIDRLDNKSIGKKGMKETTCQKQINILSGSKINTNSGMAKQLSIIGKQVANRVAIKTLKLFGLLLIIFVLGSCKKMNTDRESNYVFIKSYCAQVTVGGVVGLAEKCFNPGDTVSGKKISNVTILIRIAPHSDLNDLPPNPNSFQEHLMVPSEYLLLLKK